MVQAVPASTVAATAGVSYVDWPAILAGAVLASAIAFVLTAFGAAIGLSLVSPFEGEGIDLPLGMIAVALWLVWVSVSSFMAGGYLAGRLRHRVPDATEHEVDVRDGAHGLVVWATGAIIGAVLLGSGAATGARIGAAGVGAAATAAGAAAAATAEDGDLRYIVDRLLRGPGETAPAATGAAAGDADGTGNEVIRILLANAGEEQLAPDDKTYLAELIARQTGISVDEATARVNQGFGRMLQSEAAAREAADAARRFSVVSAFVLAASLLLGGAGAYWASQMGGRHRDRQLIVAWLAVR